MKATKILSLLAFFAICTLTSCIGNGDSSSKSTSTLSNLFNAVIDMNTGDVTLYNSVSYNIEWDYGKSVANITAQGIQLPNASTLPKIQINDIPLKTTSNGWLNVIATDYSPADYAGLLLFNNFALRVAPLGSTFSLSYLINNQYQVYSLPQFFALQGNTQITNLNTNIYFNYNGDYLPTYYISYDTATKNGFLVIQNAKFAENASTMNLKLPLLPFTVNPNGTVTMSASEAQPTQLSSSLDTYTAINAAGTPLTNAKASDIFVNFDPNSGTIIRFNYTIDNGDLGQEKYHWEFDVNYSSTSL